MFNPKESETHAQIMMMAKSGNRDARDYLKRTYKLYIFTYEEVSRVNDLIKQGVTMNEAITQVRRIKHYE